MTDSIPLNVSGPYLVSIDRSLTLLKMIEAGRYDNHAEAIESITEERFPMYRSGELQYEKELFIIPPLCDDFGVHEWKVKLDVNGWRCEEAAELLALGAQFPDLQRDHTITAYGSSWLFPDGGSGSLFCPVLWSESGKRLTSALAHSLHDLLYCTQYSLVSRRLR